MLDQAEKQIITISDKTINILGLTGAGKSTLLCFLLNLKSIVETNDFGQNV